MSAAHHFGKQRQVSGAHENEERVNALMLTFLPYFANFV